MNGAAPAEALGKLGLRVRRGSSGIASSCVSRGRRFIAPRLEQNGALDDVQQIIRWGSADGQTSVFESEHRALAHALLLPWRKRAAPFPLPRNQRFLLSAFKKSETSSGPMGLHRRCSQNYNSALARGKFSGAVPSRRRSGCS